MGKDRRNTEDVPQGRVSMVEPSQLSQPSSDDLGLLEGGGGGLAALRPGKKPGGRVSSGVQLWQSAGVQPLEKPNRGGGTPRNVAKSTVSYLGKRVALRRKLSSQLLQKPMSLRNDDDIEKLEELLWPVKFLQNVPGDLRKELCRVARYKVVLQNGYLFHENDAGDSFYVILSGRVAVVKWNEDTKKMMTLSHLTTGSYFGEIALLEENNTRTAGIQAMEDTDFLVINRDEYNRILRKVMAEDQRERLDFLKRISIFREVMHADLLALAGTLQIRVFPPNAVVAREGTDADELFLIKRGQCRVVKGVVLEQTPDPERVMVDAGRLQHGDVGPLNMFKDYGVMAPMPPWREDVPKIDVDDVNIDLSEFDTQTPRLPRGAQTDRGLRRDAGMSHMSSRGGLRRDNGMSHASHRSRGGGGGGRSGAPPRVSNMTAGKGRIASGRVRGAPSLQRIPSARGAGAAATLPALPRERAEDGNPVVRAPNVKHLHGSYTGNSSLLKELFEVDTIQPRVPVDDIEWMERNKMKKELKALSTIARAKSMRERGLPIDDEDMISAEAAAAAAVLRADGLSAAEGAGEPGERGSQTDRGPARPRLLRKDSLPHLRTEEEENLIGEVIGETVNELLQLPKLPEPDEATPRPRGSTVQHVSFPGGWKRQPELQTRKIKMMLEVGEVGPNEFFGEVGNGPVSRPGKRQFSVITRKETEVYVLNRFDFYRRLHPDILTEVDASMEEFCDPKVIFSQYMSSMGWEAYKSSVVAGVMERSTPDARCSSSPQSPAAWPA